VDFVALLQQRAARYPDGPGILALDSAPTHTAKVVQRWLATNPRLEVVWLPKYAAHAVNPIERVWGLLKTAAARTRLCGSMNLVVAAGSRNHTNLAPHSVALPDAA
jgi:hypothetical protein